LQDIVYLGNMDAKRDWGHAKDYVEMQWLMLQQDEPDDFCIATGIQYSVRDFINFACDHIGVKLEYKGEGINEKGIIKSIDKNNQIIKRSKLNIQNSIGKTIISVDEKYFRPTEVEALLGDPSKAKEKLGWKPKVTFEEMVHEMMENDINIAKRDSLVKKHGYKTENYY